MAVSAVGACSSSSTKTDGSVADTGSQMDTGSPVDTAGGTDTAAPVQYFILTWLIDDFTTGAALTCAQATAATVQVRVDTTMTFNLPCAPGQGMTGVVAPGSHTVAASLLDAQQRSLSDTGSMTVTLLANAPRALPTITFDVN
jgi:hypothetical protein